MRYFNKIKPAIMGSSPILPHEVGSSMVERLAQKKPLSLVPFRSNFLSYVVKGESYFTFNEKILGSSPDVAARSCSLMVRPPAFTVRSRKYCKQIKNRRYKNED